MYRAITAVVVRDGEILLLQRNSGIWQFVTGGMEDGEEALDTLPREVKEESGIEDFDLIARLGKRNFTTSSGKEVEADVFVIEIEDEDVTVEHNPDDEHKDWQWVSVEKAEELLEFDDQLRVLEKTHNTLQTIRDL